MEDFLVGVVGVFIKEYGPGVLPWICVLVLAGTFGLILRSLLVRLFAQDAIIIELLREGAEADREMAVEYRRLADVVTLGGLGRKR